jgi:hypothetical protein
MAKSVRAEVTASSESSGQKEQRHATYSLALYCIASSCATSFAWHLHGAVHRLTYRQDITVTAV